MTRTGQNLTRVELVQILGYKYVLDASAALFWLAGGPDEWMVSQGQALLSFSEDGTEKKIHWKLVVFDYL